MWRLGLIGAGWMAGMCCEGMSATPEIEVVVVHCRNLSRAKAFAAEYSIAAATDSLQELLAREDVDAVYIATTNESHAKLALAAITAGKAVLVEKPFTLNYVEAARVVEAAQLRGVLLMEAMWSRFCPGMLALYEILQAGVIGKLRTVRMEQGTVLTPQKNPRVYDLEKGGGALLDIGVYPVSVLEMLTDCLPEWVENRMIRHSSGVDVRDEITFRFQNGVAAQILVSCEEERNSCLDVVGEHGCLHCADYTFVKEFQVESEEGVRRYDFATDTYRYVFQMRHFAECLRTGSRESRVFPPSRTLRVMRMLDHCRVTADYYFPQER